VKVQEALSDKATDELFIYSITLDAPTDTPEVLKEYAELYGVGPGWTFLTGDFDAIEELRHRLGAYDPDPIIDADKTQHAGILVFGNDPKGRWCALPSGMRTGPLVRLIERVMFM
jgi:protein SCO1/2